MGASEPGKRDCIPGYIKIHLSDSGLLLTLCANHKTILSHGQLQYICAKQSACKEEFTLLAQAHMFVYPGALVPAQCPEAAGIKIYHIASLSPWSAQE
jgi:hypothetical protein